MGVGFGLSHAVDVEEAVTVDVNGLAGSGYAALDERATRDLGIGKRDDVAGLRVAEIVADLLGEHHVAGHDGLLHGAGGNLVSGEDVRAQRPGKPEDECDHDEKAQK